MKIVAAVQFDPKSLNVEENLSTAQRLTFEAATRGARIIVLPELCISGCDLQGPRDAAECCQQRDGYQTQAFVPIAEMFNCHIVFGYVELCEGKMHNSAAIVCPGGSVVNARKHNLWGTDYMWATASEDMHPVVVTTEGRLGALVCGDVENTNRRAQQRRLSQNRFYLPGNVDVIALPTNWNGELGHSNSNWVDLAEEAQAHVIVSNRIGEQAGMQFNGGSCVVTKYRKVWTHGSSFTDETIVGGVIDP